MKQMMIIGPGLLAVLGEMPPQNENPIVNHGFAHHANVDRSLYANQAFPAPPEGKAGELMEEEPLDDGLSSIKVIVDNSETTMMKEEVNQNG